MFSILIFMLTLNVISITNAGIPRSQFVTRLDRQNSLDCPDNEQVYQNKNNELYCDCEPGNVYHAATNKCYNAYTQGPCQTGQYIILKSNRVNCVPNPCGNDEIVSYNGICHKLNLPGGPCPPISDGGGVLSVNIETYELGCFKEDDRLNIFGNFPKRVCVPGSSRVQC